MVLVGNIPSNAYENGCLSRRAIALPKKSGDAKKE
jgi:hypothetical protein